MKSKFLIVLLAAIFAAPALGGDWYRWRGPEQTGVSREKNLPESWDPDTGENVVWKTEGVGGMSSPIVMNGRLYTLTRIGDVPRGGNVTPGPQTQEALVCLDANTGEKLWQHAENMFQTDLPFHRLGWSNVAGDPETKRVYAYGAQGFLYCLDAETGKEIWKRAMAEEFGMISTFGGRTPSPAIDEDQLFIAGVSFGWGDHARSQYRVFCFDKNTGELRWSNSTGGIPVDAPYGTPMIGVIAGQRQVVVNAGDGSVTAFQARTGVKNWSHKVSKRGLNASVLIQGDRVYACSSEENEGTSVMGAVVCIDASGEKPKEVWRQNGIEVGFASPTIANGQLYVMTNSGRVMALDTETGKILWKKSAGTIGKASLVWADGKLYVPEANARMVIMEPGEKKAEIVHKVEIVEEKLGREYDIFGSVAIANGRIYLATANTIYCIGNKEGEKPGTDDAKSEDAAPVSAEADPISEPPKEAPVPEDAKVAHIQVLPFDVVTRPGEQVKLTARAFDEKGRLIGEVKDAKWSIGKLEFEAPPKALPTDRKQGDDGGDTKPAAPATPPAPVKVQIGNLDGEVSNDGTFTAGEGLLGGGVYAESAGVSGHARVRVVPPLPWNMGFTRAATDRPPITWIGAGGKFEVQEKDGEKLLTKLLNIDLYSRARTYFGTADMRDYTIQADVSADEKMLGVREQQEAAANAEAAATEGEGDEAAAGDGEELAGEDGAPQPASVGRRFIPDIGLINSRYLMQLAGSHQEVSIFAWPSEVEYIVHKTVPFKWEPNTWYRMKLKVSQQDGKALVQGKVWPADAEEPEEWTVEMTDTLPNTNGAPGLFGASGVTPGKAFIYYDNIRVSSNNEEEVEHAQN